jgi:hypothetical protein
MLEGAVVLVLCVWGIATIFYQFHATADAVNKWNYFSLIPKWTFFAPRPKTTDYQLCYQDRCVGSGTVGDPVALAFTPNGRIASALRFIWNPSKRNSKAVIDITSFIMTYKVRHRRRIARDVLVLELYVPYLALLNYVSAHAHVPAPEYRRRFVVLQTFGYYRSEQPVPVLESNFHRVEPLV